jgi:phosphoenolpyruvate-protein phosphotransferase (PTS system enzyme I)
MDIKRGIAVSPGVAIGPALVLDTEGFRIERRIIEPDRREFEVQRLYRGLAAAAAATRTQQLKVSAQIGSQYGAIFGAHALLIEDASLGQEVEHLIRQQGFSAEYAFSRVMRRFARTLENLEGGHFTTRVADLLDIEKSVLHILLGQQCEQLRTLEHPAIVLAHDLTPSQTAALDTAHVFGFATEAGGRASHTAILAGVLSIPAVVGLGKVLFDVSGGDIVIIDGHRGLLIVDPDEATLKEYEAEKLRDRRFEDSLETLRDLPAETSDGTRITLLGNIEFPDEAVSGLERGAEGVGLYRTEFLYLDSETDPAEEDHFAAYLTVVRAMGQRPVVIRTLDLGGDKVPGFTESSEERNPFLGLRSVRLCLRNLTLFKTQLRAILRASAFGDVRILFPMVSTLLELRQCKMLLAEVKEDLEEEHLAFNQRLKVGTMIEVPSAAILADLMAREVDFFSIGTNDLIQYTLAADRTNEAVANLYSPGDPAVLRLIEQVVQAGRQQEVGVNVCGEMSGEPMYALLLLGLGLRQLSLTPHNIPEVKKLIRSVTIPQAEAIAREVLRMETARDVNNYLREQTKRLLPRYDEVRGGD